MTTKTSRVRHELKKSGRNNLAHRRNQSGFTLIEVLVVISIAAIISAITLGGFGTVAAGNKRTSCQANLTQIYVACQQYAADEGGKFPYYEPGPPNRNIGLWSLYTFPSSTDSSKIATVGDKPVERYLRSSKSLHCPNDNRDNNDLYTDETRTAYNWDYLSYQVKDPDSLSLVWTYNPVRTTNKSDADWNRQLLPFSGSVQSFRTPSDQTVVTWCPFHRTGLGGRSVDPVLFYDGSVQLIPVTQPDPDVTNQSNPPDLTDWHRRPRGNDG